MQDSLTNWQDFIKAYIGIISILNPIGIIPVFLGATEKYTKSQQRRTVHITTLTIGITLLVSAWVGQYLLWFFGVGIPAFRVGGGILILLMAISMLQARQSMARQTPDEAEEVLDREAIGVVPLGIPLMCGPGSITLSIVLADKYRGAENLMMLSLMMVLVSLTVLVIYRFAINMGRRLGKTELNIATRIMGLVLAAMAIEFIASGARVLFPGLANGLH